MEKTRLSQEEWRRVEEVYHEALEHRPESRAAFVTAACSGDSSLRREVGRCWQRTVLSLQCTSLLNCSTTVAPLAPGAELGPYRIEKLIGSGGSHWTEMVVEPAGSGCAGWRHIIPNPAEAHLPTHEHGVERLDAEDSVPKGVSFGTDFGGR
jgi:hypothetical protein